MSTTIQNKLYEGKRGLFVCHLGTFPILQFGLLEGNLSGGEWRPTIFNGGRLIKFDGETLTFFSSKNYRVQDLKMGYYSEWTPEAELEFMKFQVDGEVSCNGWEKRIRRNGKYMFSLYPYRITRKNTNTYIIVAQNSGQKPVHLPLGVR